jgi:hypothetical protein
MKEEVLIEFGKASQELLDLLYPLNDEQLNIIPFEGSWTAGQLGDHVLKSYAVVETLNGRTKPTERPIGEKIDGVVELFSNYEIKMKSPEAVLPTNDPVKKRNLVYNLQRRIDQIKEIIRTKDLSETCVDFVIPQYSEFTRLEWIWFVIVHTKRHVRQLKNIIRNITVHS